MERDLLDSRLLILFTSPSLVFPPYRQFYYKLGLHLQGLVFVIKLELFQHYGYGNSPFFSRPGLDLEDLSYWYLGQLGGNDISLSVFLDTVDIYMDEKETALKIYLFKEEFQACNDFQFQFHWL